LAAVEHGELIERIFVDSAEYRVIVIINMDDAVSGCRRFTLVCLDPSWSTAAHLAARATREVMAAWRPKLPAARNANQTGD
jgi:hypothetical protein